MYTFNSAAIFPPGHPYIGSTTVLSDISSKPPGDGDMIKAKWLSLENHIHNKHSGHGDKFPKCAHARLTGKRKWFKKSKHKNQYTVNSPASVQIPKQVKNSAPS